MKRGRRILLILLACGVAVAAIAIVWPREPEPVYHGRTLSQWLAKYEERPDARVQTDFGPREDAEAAAAVRQIGAKAIPLLLKWVAHEDPAWTRKAMGLGGWVVRPVSLGLSDRLFARAGSYPSRQAERALLGFDILGAAASAAIPELTRLVNGARYQPAVNAMGALSQIGGEGLPVLMGVVSNSANSAMVSSPGNQARRLAAVARIGRMGTNAYPAVPMLVGCLQDKDRRVAIVAAVMLGRLRIAPDLVVPALAAATQDTNVRRGAVYALGQFGELARPALPAVESVLSDTDEFMRKAATNALRKIAPEVLGSTNCGQGTGPEVVDPARRQ